MKNTNYAAEKSYLQNYYDQSDTDTFYQKVSGGEHVHIGLFEHKNEDLEIAKKRTTEYIASLVDINNSHYILDLGSGYGGTARYLSQKYSCRVSCLNISKKQNAINHQRNQELGLTDLITVEEGTFEQLPYPDSRFNIVWSQDAIFHSSTPKKVFQESSRVLLNQGEFIFSVVLLDDQISDQDKQKITQYYSLNLQYLQTYRNLASQVGLAEVQVIDLSENIAINYSRLLTKMEALQAADPQLWSLEFFTKMQQRLRDWVKAGEQGLIRWGILHYQKNRF
ncbi:MAG: methyltransferase domain-containing protein [Symploca sp. SIO2D2]|nr:methyltransferase domain-containing protein [Symploca sp. SIO2D2]